MDLTVFVSYMNSPENGLDGILGLARSQYNQDMNFLYQLSQIENFGFLNVMNYQFYFNQTVEDGYSNQYSGFLLLSEEPDLSY